MGFRGEDSAVRGEDLCFRRDLVLAFVGFRVFVARLLGFRRESFGLCLGGSGGRRLSGLRGEDLGLVGSRAFVGIRAFVEGVGFGLSWRGIRGGEAFALSWRSFRAFAGRVSSFGGRLLGEGFGRILGLGRIWVSWGYELSWGGIQAFESVYESKASGSPLKRIDFASRLDFTRLDVRAASLKKELSWAPSCAAKP